MNIKLKTLSALILSMQLSHGAMAVVPDFFNGMDEVIETELKKSPLFQKQGRIPSFLLPSHRFMNAQMLQNLRFEGNYGPYKPDLLLPFQMQGIDACEHGIFPHDACAALLQCLFPSPDGAVLLANQAYSDILSRITPGMAGSLLRRVIAFQNTSPDARNDKGFLLGLYATLLGIDDSDPSEYYRYEHLLASYPDYLRHDCGVSLTRKAEEKIEYLLDLEMLPESDKESLRGEYPMSALMGLPMFQRYFGRSVFQNGELESYNAFLNGFSRYKSLVKKPLKTLNIV